MYADINFRTKKQLKESVKAGTVVRVISPGPFPPHMNGREFIEGPHYPDPHTWYAEVTVKDGIIVTVK
jgi:hypothetical protein